MVTKSIEMGPAIEVSGLCKTYRPRHEPAVVALDQVDLVVAAGQAVGLLGARGAGKTTIVRLLGGYARPTAGAIRLRGHDLRAERAVALAQIGGLWTDRAALPSGRTVRDHLARLAQASDTGVERLLRATTLWEQRDTAVRDLSPGQRRLVTLASALAADPPILLLDEPTRGLDGAEARAVLAAIRNVMRSRTVVLATAHVAIACDLCERIVLLDAGRLVGEHTRGELLDLLRQERYTIRVKGHLSPAWSEWFDGMTVANEDGGEAAISGLIADQSALHGVLARIHALNLPLLSVSRAEPSLGEILTQLYGET